jgi:hypothetical protein
MKINLMFIAMIMAVLLLSCNKQSNNSDTPIGEIKVKDVAMNAPPKFEEEKQVQSIVMLDSTASAQPPSTNVLQAGQPAPMIDWDKKIIKTANIKLELKDYSSYNQIIHNSTKRYGAYIASEQQTEQDGKLENSLSIKVPVDQFEALMNALPVEGVKLIEKQITTEDVTVEVVDTKSRIVARKKIRDRYLDLLKQAKNMKEILEVQNEINTIQEDIEAGTGRVDYLVHQAAYSTINLKYYQYLFVNKIPDEEPTFITKLKEAFNDGASIVSGFILIVITFWPFLLSALLLWYFIKRHSIRQLKVIKKL